MSFSVRLTLFAGALLTVVACSSSDPPVTPPLTPPQDAAVDPQTDGATDSASADSSEPDAAEAATPDGPVDDGSATDAPTIDSTADTATADTDIGLDSSDDVTTDAPADTSTDSSPCAVFGDGTYDWGVWTCGTNPTTDIRAFAISVGIASVDETIVGDAGTVNSNYSGSPACSRTTEFVNTYPSCNTVTTTTSSTYTCSATCPAATCSAGTQAVLVSTYTLSINGNTITGTRVLDAADLSQMSLQKAAGCQVGDTEISEMIRR